MVIRACLAAAAAARDITGTRRPSITLMAGSFSRIRPASYGDPGFLGATCLKEDQQ